MPTLPSKKQIRDFIEKEQASSGRVTRREIARAFNIKGEARTQLRSLLKAMASDGLIDLDGKRTTARGALPPMAVLDITAIDQDGDLACAPPNWKESYAPPAILLESSAAAKTRPPLGKGDRFLGKLQKQDDGTYLAKPVKHIGQGADRVLGVYRTRKVGGTVEPVSRKVKRALLIERGDENGAKEDDLVWAEIKNTRGYGPNIARIREIVGRIDDPSTYSQIAIANHEIRMDFPEAVLREAENACLPEGESHEDLRQTALITIDPADARDHDDAVYAEPDPDPKNKNGWRVIVAIADVAWFVTPGSALDREAQKRGNSTYLPDMVVPMLPERLSNDLCSLRENEDRPALAVEMRFAEDGRKIDHRFMRIMMRSHARLSYREVQNAIDGTANDRAKPWLEPVLKPLWRAYEALKKAREKRSPLDLDLPERQIVFDENGHVTGVKLKERFDANKLIEEFMIQANVCAAETLEQYKLPLIYRVHGDPDPEKLEAVRSFLESMNYSLPKGQVLRPKNLNQVLQLAAERDESALIGQVLLRSQRQAIYDTQNLGHFGLNLTRYAHFTSPIRRYADLTVHRALIAARNLGKGAQSEEEAHRLDTIAEAISILERSSMAAERESTDRFLAAWLENRVGAEFKARINGVTRSGLFVTLDDTGADGFIPARTLGHEYFRHEEAFNALVGEQKGGVYRLGQAVQVRLMEVTPLQGGLLFEMLSEPLEGVSIPHSDRKGRQGRGKKGYGQRGRSFKGSSDKSSSPPRKKRPATKAAPNRAERSEAPEKEKPPHKRKKLRTNKNKGKPKGPLGKRR